MEDFGGRVVPSAEQWLAVMFALRPNAPVTVKREPAYSEKSAAAHDSDPARDGSLPGHWGDTRPRWFQSQAGRRMILPSPLSQWHRRRITNPDGSIGDESCPVG